MSFDNDTRNLLARTVTSCRRRLTADVTDQLRGIFGLHPDGTVLPLDKLTHLSPDQNSAARHLRDLLDHYISGSAGKESDRRMAAYERMVLEISFTVLNRLAALRLCEERGLVIECVREGTTSAGFQMFERISGGILGGRYETYRVFLECLFDELALDLGVLFDRMTPQSAVFPTERCMEDVLDELNRAELMHLWNEDETIGWIYQYFNPPEERKAMRDGSKAPRNSRELAVRNQFFTPRYVVEFLTDNTIGRMWYEMRKGQTALKENCSYLVRRPNEVFLKPGDKASVDPEKEADLSQEELVKKLAYIEHRPKKDPRDLHVLDPACGSGHFLLYSFALLEQIYEEAWADPESPESEVTGQTLGEEFETLADLRQTAPKLILEHNLHGIDIDPRAVQIAALALWLLAQKTWQNLNIRAAERPCIVKSNIVTAEPMPGEEDLRREFTAEIKPRVLGQLVDIVFDKMKLAGEAGSLLKIEEEIKDAVAEARKQLLEGPKPEQQLLFSRLADSRPKQQELRFDLSGVTDMRFWEQAEDCIFDALKDYAERAEMGHGVRRRLFAEDAASGFAFLDLCRFRYDVVLMNPPFGDVSEGSKRYVFAEHAREKTELAACFVTRTLGMLSPGGSLGVISNRTFLFADSFQAWKTAYLKDLTYCADFGFGVLEAVVETVAFVIGYQATSTTLFIGLMNSPNKEGDLLDALIGLRQPTTPASRVFVREKNALCKLGNEWFYYWISGRILRTAKSLAAKETGLLSRPGLQTCDNFRFVRLRWEVQSAEVNPAVWVPLSKGGDYQPFWADLHLVALWTKDGEEMKAFIEASYASWSKQIPSINLYFKAGLTYSERTTSSMSLRVLPAGALFDKQGPFIGYQDSTNRDKLLIFLGLSYTFLFRVLVESQVGFRDSTVAGSTARHYMPSMIEKLPLPKLSVGDEKRMLGWVRDSIRLQRRMSSVCPTDSAHAALPGLAGSSSISDMRFSLGDACISDMKCIYSGLAHANQVLEDLFSLDENENEHLRFVFGPSLESDQKPLGIEVAREVERLLALDESTLVEETLARVGYYPSIRKQSFVANRMIETAALKLSLSPAAVLDRAGNFDWLLPLSELSQILADVWIGYIFGRWDIRFATCEKSAPDLPDPFARTPDCPPGMFQNAQGLPASPENVPEDYPLRISWDGILVDDPSIGSAQPHQVDIVRCVREVIDLLWKDKAQDIEEEFCDIICVSDLRDYFRKPTAFFQDHLKRYSKSRRKAPIYWPLSTTSGSYILWLYYHRLNEQTIYTAVNKYVEPKILEVERAMARIQDELSSSSASSARLRDRLDEGRTFLGELRELRDELLHIAALPLKPNLNDGVIINAAPFHKLFRLRSWSKDTEDCWHRLEKGEYDWAHLAYKIWPDRVKEVCKRDRSIAIAHGLEDLCEVQAPATKKKGDRTRRKRETAE